jgi:hypothetical protein
MGVRHISMTKYYQCFRKTNVKKLIKPTTKSYLPVSPPLQLGMNPLSQ